MNTIKIGLTACGNYTYYHQWFINEPGVEIIKLDYEANDFDIIKRCDGIVLTGGQDIHPRYYGKTPADIPNATAIDEQRDAFEWKVLQYTQQEQLPVLGICRGMQLANVFFGGSLIEDIPSTGKNNHSKIREGMDRHHPIAVVPGSGLAQLVGVLSGEINSAHHQSVATVGSALVASAYSDDGIIEAVEKADQTLEPYLLLVQWHPERMTDPGSPFSAKIKDDFLRAVKQSTGNA